MKEQEKRSITIKKAFQKHKNFLEAIVLVIQSTFDENIGVCNSGARNCFYPGLLNKYINIILRLIINLCI
ncbi:hypothetical protein NC651_008689 [Populus alba x Populus x berolinensis]|nr:hypothetical protein NC651_008689 [Populus alba x Populus x berolinensis]